MKKSNLSTVLANIAKEELQSEHLKEIEVKTYKPQESFSSCKERANALMYNAIQRITNFYALSILSHREVEHGEDHAKEKEEITTAMSAEDIQLATSRSWWRF